MIKNTIKQHRKLLKLRQSDLAEDLTVTRQTINSIENSKYLPSLELAFKLARLFNCKIEDLFEISSNNLPKTNK